MDTEGFSGRDGRTSIFDYWSMDSIRKWRNGGKFDGKKITPEQQHLLDFYRLLLTLSTHEKAISCGQFFDLMYANQNGWKFNEHKQYTFCENTKTNSFSLLLTLIVWLLKLPSIYPRTHLIIFKCQTEGYEATDLLTNKRKSFLCSPTKLPDKPRSTRSQNFEDYF